MLVMSGDTCYDDWHLRSTRQENLSSVCLSHWGRIKDAQKSDSEWKLWAAHFTGTNKLSFYSFIMCQHFVVCWVSFRELKTSDWNSEIIHERKILKRDYFHKRESLNQNLISGNLNILSSYRQKLEAFSLDLGFIPPQSITKLQDRNLLTLIYHCVNLKSRPRQAGARRGVPCPDFKCWASDEKILLCQNVACNRV